MKHFTILLVEMKDPEARRTMLEIAAYYDVLAERAAQRMPKG